MMEEQLSQSTVTHLLQHTLRSFCIHENSHWVYAVFWRILPRNYPPPKWETQAGAYDRSRGNRRNWILAWEDGFCNFAASTSTAMATAAESECRPYEYQQYQGLQPELFFKMSHEIYNYGEGIIGKVAADHSHKWIFKEPADQEINFLSTWNNSADSHPRTWEAQFQAGIKTIALIAVREGVFQLGSLHKVNYKKSKLQIWSLWYVRMARFSPCTSLLALTIPVVIEDLSYVVMLRKKLSYIESIPGVLLPHPSSSVYPFKAEGYNPPEAWPFHGSGGGGGSSSDVPPPYNQPLNITPSMSSLEALLSKLPSVVPPMPAPSFCEPVPPHFAVVSPEKVVEEEEEIKDVGECSSSMSSYSHQQQHFHHDVNVSSCMTNNRY